jgi:hypothetical protein
VAQEQSTERLNLKVMVVQDAVTRPKIIPCHLPPRGRKNLVMADDDKILPAFGGLKNKAEFAAA